MLGFRQYTLYLKFSDPLRREDEFIKKIKSDFNIGWIGKLAGEWTLATTMYCRDDNELQQQLNGIFAFLGKDLIEYKLLINLEKIFFYEKLENRTVYQTRAPQKTQSLDKTNMRILKELNADSRVTYARLSEKIGLTANAIMARVRKFEKSGIIIGYGAVVDTHLMNLEIFGLHIKFTTFEPEAKKQFKNHLAESKDVAFFYEYVSGEIDIGIMVKDNSRLRDFLNKVRSEFSGKVTVESFFLLTEQITDGKLPKKVFQEHILKQK